MDPERQTEFDRITAILPGYPAHCAWLAQSFGFRRHAPPGGTKPGRLWVPGADLTGANLSYADLSDSNLSGVNLSHANLSYANITRAKLSGANLSGANLSGAKLYGTILFEVNLSGAYGIRSAGPVDAEGQMIYGVAHEGGAMIRAGCFWYTVPEMIAVVNTYFADGSGREQYRAMYLAAIDSVREVEFPPK